MQVFRLLVESTKEIEGAKVEDNKFCVSVHYRNVDEKASNFALGKLYGIGPLCNGFCLCFSFECTRSGGLSLNGFIAY